MKMFGSSNFTEESDNANVVDSRLPDCRALCSNNFKNDKQKGAIPPEVTIDVYVQHCTKQMSRKGKCVDLPPWDPNRGRYFNEPFVLPPGQTCPSVCEKKSKDNLFNRDAPNFVTE